MNIRNLLALLFYDFREHLHSMEKRIMAKIDDAVARLETGIANNTQAVANAQAAISAEIRQLADAASGGNTDGLADRLTAVADSLDASTANLVSSTNGLTSDDAPVVTNPGQGDGSQG